ESAPPLARLRWKLVRDRHVNVVGLLIESNRPAAARRRYVFDDLIFAAHLLNDSQRAVAVGADDVSGAGIEGHSVGSCSDCSGCDDLARIGIRYHHDSIAAHGKQPAL